MIAEKRLQRKERNKLKEAQKSGRANKAGHKRPEYNSDRFDDKLVKTG